MTKKTRLIVLIVCVVCFLVVVPALVFYSMGDRFDFKKMKVVETGGIYVRTFPAAEKIVIDSKITEKPGLFSNSIFVQSLLPNNHTVLVEKNGYYNYSKTIPVEEKQVTKLENILLIKKDLPFEIITDEGSAGYPSPFSNQEKFVIKNNNLYYSSSPVNSALTAIQKTTPVVKKVVSFTLQNDIIIWLGTDGFLYKSELTDVRTITTKINLTAIKISKTGSYKIISDNNDIFLIADGDLLYFNAKTSELENFYNSVKNANISPDGKNIVYYDANNIYISPISATPFIKNTLYKSSDIITNCLWVNSSYIVLTAGSKIIISETDYRGNINYVTLPQIIETAKGEKIDITNPQIYFNQQSGKLYILSNNTLLLSEKITP